jgi:hypothetical protein
LAGLELWSSHSQSLKQLGLQVWAISTWFEDVSDFREFGAISAPIRHGQAVKTVNDPVAWMREENAGSSKQQTSTSE